ncbi:MAG TPA: alpha/beta hydrolase [Pyrinomonadaceae bacterium]|nr:alpha/beta hydrolase [Pyrinomonadaceae bacterium]
MNTESTRRRPLDAARAGRETGTRAGKFESHWATVGGLRIHARVSAAAAHDANAGSVPVVVLVHGLVVSSLYMMPTAEKLARSYPVFAPDMPGFGKSDAPARTLNVLELADALAAWMDAMSIGRAVLVGNSLGCQIIAALAARSPHKVAGIVLAGATVDPAGRSRREQFKRLLLDATRERYSLMLLQLRGLCEAGLKRSWQTANYALEDRIEANLPHIHAPALVVCGTRDPIAPPTWAKQMAAMLPRARLALVSGAPHALNYTTPEELALLVSEFIERDVSAT